jgi:hypothetical protein
MTTSTQVPLIPKHRLVTLVLVTLGAGLLLFLAILFEEQYAGLDSHHQERNLLGSEFVDAVAFRTTEAIAATGMATAAIALVFEAYQGNIDRSRRLREVVVEREGVLDTFVSDSDPRFLAVAQEALSSARTEIVAAGLGLGFLSHNPSLVDAMVRSMNARHSTVKVSLLHGSESVNGVAARIAEEQSWHDARQFNYDKEWVTRYPQSIRDRVVRQLSAGAASRFDIRAIVFTPYVSVLKVDDLVFMSPYGPPGLRGSDSPWILLDGRAAGGFLLKFVSTFLEEATS